jgi:hypothetical protein
MVLQLVKGLRQQGCIQIGAICPNRHHRPMALGKGTGEGSLETLPQVPPRLAVIGHLGA